MPDAVHIRAAVSLAAIMLMAALAGVYPALAQAAVPALGATWVTGVTAGSASMHGEVNPESLSTAYRFEYITEVAYQANLNASREGFTGAAKAPAGGSSNIGAGSGAQSVTQHVSALRSATTYHYRLNATNSSGTSLGTALTFNTQEITSGAFTLPDQRGWEMVSRRKKTAAPFKVMKKTTVATYCRPPNRVKQRSPIPPLLPLAKARRVHRRPASTSPAAMAHRAGRPKTSPRRRCLGPMAINRTESPISSSPRNSRAPSC